MKALIIAPYAIAALLAVAVALIGIAAVRRGRLPPRPTALAVIVVAVGLFAFAWFWPMAPVVDRDVGNGALMTGDQFPPQEPTPQASASIGSAADYARQAMAWDLYEIQSGQIARNRGSTEQLRNFGQRMAREHEELQVSLGKAMKQGAGAGDLTATLTPDQERDVEALRQAPDDQFDRLYLEQQRAAHQKLLALHQAMESQADAEALAAFATGASKKVRAHAIDIEQLGSGT